VCVCVCVCVCVFREFTQLRAMFFNDDGSLNNHTLCVISNANGPHDIVVNNHVAVQGVEAIE
jgi:hypothetical protein